MLDIVSSLIKEVAATEIIPRFQNLKKDEIRAKGKDGSDVVTEADIAAERKLTEELKKILPGSAVLGEEAYAEDPEIWEKIKDTASVWIIDPIDGTKNFSEGKEYFGVMVALVKAGEIVMGWIYDPLRNTIFLAEKGAGAFCANRLCRLKHTPDFSQMEGANGKNVRFKDGTLSESPFWSSAAYNYMRLLSGKSDYSVYRTNVIKPWDHAAGTLIFEETGGFVRYIDGSSYKPDFEKKVLIAAPSETAWDYLKTNLTTGDR